MPFDDIAEHEDDDFVRDHEHVLAAVLTRDAVERAPDAQRDIAPALAAGRAMVELADPAPCFGLLGVLRGDPGFRQPIEHAELTLAQPLVEHEREARCGRSRARSARSHGLAAYGEVSATAGRDLPRQSPSSQWPSAAACGAPLARRARRPRRAPATSMTVSPAASAARRATFPTLSPWRTKVRDAGQRSSSAHRPSVPNRPPPNRTTRRDVVSRPMNGRGRRSPRGRRRARSARPGRSPWRPAGSRVDRRPRTRARHGGAPRHR